MKAPLNSDKKPAPHAGGAPSAQSPQLRAASGARAFRIKKTNPGPAYGWPMGIWFSVFFIVPIAIIVVYSFMTRDVYGGIVFRPTLRAYAQMFSASYGRIFLRTLWIAVVSTAVILAMALPCGYAMARSRHQTLLLILVVVPFFTNSLIRIFAWMTILGENGILNDILRALHNLACRITGSTAEFTAHRFMFTPGAVILVSIYMYLPYAILPIFTAVDRFDFTLLEAARDLGATKIVSMFRVLIPCVRSGIISALIFTFIPIFGTYTVPQLVGGRDSYMVGNIIVDQVQRVRNWPLASAFSVIITAISMAGILIMLSSGRRETEMNKTSGREDTTTPLAASRGAPAPGAAAPGAAAAGTAPGAGTPTGGAK